MTNPTAAIAQRLGGSVDQQDVRSDALATGESGSLYPLSRQMSIRPLK